MTFFLFTVAACVVVSALIAVARKACGRWLAWRLRTPRMVRHGTPKDGRYGDLALEPVFVDLGHGDWELFGCLAAVHAQARGVWHVGRNWRPE